MISHNLRVCHFVWLPQFFLAVIFVEEIIISCWWLRIRKRISVEVNCILTWWAHHKPYFSLLTTNRQQQATNPPPFSGQVSRLCHVAESGRSNLQRLPWDVSSPEWKCGPCFDKSIKGKNKNFYWRNKKIASWKKKKKGIDWGGVLMGPVLGSLAEMSVSLFLSV